MLVRFELLRCARRASACEIARRGDHGRVHRAEPQDREARILQATDADREIDTLRDEVDRLVGEQQIDRELRETPQSVEYVKKAHVSGRLATPDDIVGTIEFLASPRARWISAQTIFVNNAYLAR